MQTFSFIKRRQGARLNAFALQEIRKMNGMKILLLSTVLSLCFSIDVQRNGVYQQVEAPPSTDDDDESLMEKRDLHILQRAPFDREAVQTAASSRYPLARTSTANGVLCKRISCTMADMLNIYGVGENGPSQTVPTPTMPPPTIQPPTEADPNVPPPTSWVIKRPLLAGIVIRPPLDPPSSSPSSTPTDPPTDAPTDAPTSTPGPTEEPTASPSESLAPVAKTGEPTLETTVAPIESTTPVETDEPTLEPTVALTESSSPVETDKPTFAPTESPSPVNADDLAGSTTSIPTAEVPSPAPTVSSPTDFPTITITFEDEFLEETKDATQVPTVSPSLQSGDESLMPTGFDSSLSSLLPTGIEETSIPTQIPTGLEQIPTGLGTALPSFESPQPTLESEGVTRLEPSGPDTSLPSLESPFPTLESIPDTSLPSLESPPPTLESTNASTTHDDAQLLCSQEEECEYTIVINADTVDNRIIADLNFELEEVLSMNSVEVSIAATYGQDWFILLTSPAGEEFVLMEDTLAIEADDSELADFDLGNNPDDPSLRNVALYKFVENGGNEGFLSPYSPEGEYNAEAWAQGPFAAGEWNLFIEDRTYKDPGSIGTVTLRFCSVSGLCTDANEGMEADATTEIPSSFPSTFEIGPPVSLSGGTQAPVPATLSPVEPGNCTPVTIDFNNLSDGTPILSGSYLWNEYSDDFGLVLSTTGGYLGFPRTFNTNRAEEENAYLGSPNERCDPSGPGIGVGGEPGAPASNCEPLGNVLIIQDDNDTSQQISNERGGTLTFAFDSRVERVEEIGLLNISEEGATIKVAFIKKSGKKAPRYIDVAAQGENSHQVVSIDRDRVFNVDVNLVGPGAVSFISICVSL